MANHRFGIVFVGMETSGALRRRFQSLGYETYSCDLLPSEDDGEEMVYSDDRLPLGRHMIGDVFNELDNLWANDLWPAAAIFHPDCTYLTGSAAWAFADPDYDRYPSVGYHQRVKPGTLVGAARRTARETALETVRRIMHLPIDLKIVENPPGFIGTSIRKPTQVIQPNQFGDDASKATCLWMLHKDGSAAPEWRLAIDPEKQVPPTLRVNGKSYWANQTDTGQNRLSPGKDRWKDRSRTFGGIADAIVARVHEHLSSQCSTGI